MHAFNYLVVMDINEGQLVIGNTTTLIKLLNYLIEDTTWF